MKKFGLQTIVILALGFLAHQFFPFWIIAVVAGLVGLLFRYENSGASYAAGFASASLLWGAYAGWLNSANLSELSGKIGEVFQISGGYLATLTGMVGGLLGGFGALTGTLLRKAFENQPDTVEQA